MLYLNDVTNEQGIFQEIDSLCDTDINSYTANAKTRRVNAALIDLELKALMNDGTWQFDDANYTTQPSGVMSAIAGQGEYTFDSTLLFIERIEILLLDGITWQKLNPFDEMEIKVSIQTQLQQNGTPWKYYKRGNKFGFNALPQANNMTLTNGIKVYFKRLGTLFNPTDTLVTPGILSPHILLAQKAALPYCQTYKPDRVPALLTTITAGEALHLQYYSNRAKDERGQMTMKRINSR